MSIGLPKGEPDKKPTSSKVAATSAKPVAPITTVSAHWEVFSITITSHHHRGLSYWLLSIISHIEWRSGGD